MFPLGTRSQTEMERHSGSKDHQFIFVSRINQPRSKQRSKCGSSLTLPPLRQMCSCFVQDPVAPSSHGGRRRDGKKTLKRPSSGGASGKNRVAAKNEVGNLTEEDGDDSVDRMEEDHGVSEEDDVDSEFDSDGFDTDEREGEENEEEESGHHYYNSDTGGGQKSGHGEGGGGRGGSLSTKRRRALSNSRGKQVRRRDERHGRPTVRKVNLSRLFARPFFCFQLNALFTAIREVRDPRGSTHLPPRCLVCTS